MLCKPEYLILTKELCPWCDKAKELAKEHNIEMEEINVQGDIGPWRQFIQFSRPDRVATVPQIYTRFNHQLFLIGGCEEFENWLTKDEDDHE